jgi:hypothetical protein
VRRRPEYDRLVLDLLATETLSRTSHPILLPPALRGWAEERGRAYAEWLEQSGVDVVGDPADLVPAPIPPGQPFKHPDRVSQKAQLRAALDALAAMTKEAAAPTYADTGLRRRVQGLRRALAR